MAIAEATFRFAIPELEDELVPIGGDLSAGVVTVTPSLARALLERNVGNRRVTDTVVTAYIREMLEDAWALNGEPLIFDKQGHVMNAQHRLWAAVKGNVSFQTVVIVGVSRDAMRTIDIGKIRTGGDHFAIARFQNANVLSAMAAHVYRYKHDLTVEAKVLPPQQFSILGAHPGLTAFTGHAKIGLRDFPGSIYAGYAYLFSLVDPDLEATLTDGLGVGVGLVKGDPVHTLRETAIRNAGMSRRVKRPVWREYIVMVWNALYTGREMRILRWTPAMGHQKIKGLARDRL